MTTNMKFPKSTRWLLLIVGLAVVFGLFSLSCNSRRATSDPNDILRDTVIQGMQDNISKLSCVTLVWKSERQGFGPWSNQPESAGSHQLWWKDRQTAISYKTTTTNNDPNGQVSLDQAAMFMTYDGKKYRIVELPQRPAGKVEMIVSPKPTSGWYENNYLQSVGWIGLGGLNHISKPTETGVETWSTESNDVDAHLIKNEFRNDSNQSVVRYYDESQGSMLVSSEQYYKNQIQIKQTVTYEEVSGETWFPVVVLTEQYSIQNGEPILRSKLEIDIDKSSFNDPSAIPENVFELEVGPNTDVTDLTSLKTKLKMRLNDF